MQYVICFTSIFGLGIFLFISYHMIYTWYKDRQWRLNNPEEHAWFDKDKHKGKGK